MDNDRIYYVADADSHAAKMVEQFKQEYRDVKTEWHEFAERYGCKSVYAGDSVEGLLFEVEPPTGWHRTRGMPSKCYKPQRRKECMEDYKAMKALPSLPAHFRFRDLLGVDMVIVGMAVQFPSFETIGDQVVISLHKDSEIPDEVAEGLTALKMSEYWELKEAQQQ